MSDISKQNAYCIIGKNVNKTAKKSENIVVVILHALWFAKIYELSD